MPAQSSDQRMISKQVLELKAAVQSCNIDQFEQCLMGAPSVALLSAIREQKLVFQVSADDWERVSEALSAAADAVLTSNENDHFKLYIQFCKISLGKRAQLSATLAHQLKAMPKLTVCDLAYLSREALNSFRLNLEKSFNVTAEDSVAVYEQRFHALNGRANDYAFAVLRAVNEIAKAGIDQAEYNSSWKIRRNSKKLFKIITSFAGLINSLDYIIDGISYGKFDIQSISNRDDGPVTLRLADERLERIRSAGIRRSLILRLNDFRHKRYVRNMLRSFQTPLIFAAIDQVLADVPNALPPDDVAPLIKSASRLLSAIDAEDDLLYAAATDRALDVTIHYFASLALQWYSAAGDFVKRKQKTGLRKRFEQLPIGLHAVVNCLVDDNARSLTVSALNRLTSDLPARSHFDLLKKPYAKSGNLHAFPLLLGDNGLWNVSVREELITGGRIGKNLGKIWEEFYAKSFSDSDWTIIGEGIRLKEKGEIITDVDLLLFREDLLLVVQIKALTGSGATQYDHWKNRKIIEWGCEQARIATEHLIRNPHTLTSVANKSISERTKHIVPVVFTNGTLFDGWIHRGVTVAGNTVRNSLIEGSLIDYTDGKTNTIIDTHVIVDKNDLTTERILWLLQNPVELQAVADEEPRLSSIKIGNRMFNVPDLELTEKATTFRDIDRPAILSEIEIG